MRSISPTQAVAAALSLALALTLSACTGSGNDEPETLPYDESLFPNEEVPHWCEFLEGLILDNGFMEDGVEVDVHGSNKQCSITQDDGQSIRDIGVNVWIQGHPNATTPQEYFDEITQSSSIPIAGLGEEAALVRMDAVGNAIGGWVSISDDGLSLAVVERNLLLDFRAYSYEDLNGPNFRLEDLTTTAESAISVAGPWLEELGADNHTLQAPDGTFDEGITALPDLCADLDPGMDLAVDQNEWADDSTTMDRCHWNDGEADLWLSAEAIGSLPAAGLSAEDFATWWAGSLPAAGGEPLELGDQSFIIDRDPEAEFSHEIETPATDFVIRIGNVVLQGRYQDGTADAHSAATAAAETIAAQAQALLESS